MSALHSFAEYVEREWPGEGAQVINCKALSLMADAVESVAAKRQISLRSIGKEMTRFRAHTTAYCQGSPEDRAQPDKLRRTLIRGSRLIAELAEAAPDRVGLTAHLNALDRAARSLDKDASPQRQPDVVERFFHHGVQVLTLLCSNNLAQVDPILPDQARVRPRACGRRLVVS